jgi:hypothetical protein
VLSWLSMLQSNFLGYATISVWNNILLEQISVGSDQITNASFDNRLSTHVTEKNCGSYPMLHEKLAVTWSILTSPWVIRTEFGKSGKGAHPKNRNKLNMHYSTIDGCISLYIYKNGIYKKKHFVVTVPKYNRQYHKSALVMIP